MIRDRFTPWRAAVVLATFAALQLGCDAALAHARLKSAMPAVNATVKSGLAEIKLRFNEAVEPALSVIELLDADGKVIASSKGQSVCVSTACTFVIEALKPGSYTVRYHVLSEDGHVVESSYGFKVAD